MTVNRPQGLIEESGRRGENRRLDQMVSARLNPTLVAALRRYAAERGISVSDVLREAAQLLLEREESKEVITFHVRITNGHREGTAQQSFSKEISVAV